MEIFNKIKWFLNENPKNQVITVLIVFLGLSLYDNHNTKSLNADANNKHFTDDSLRIVRYNNNILRWQEDYKRLQEQRILEEKKCSEDKQKLSKDYFEATDKLYHKLFKKP